MDTFPDNQRKPSLSRAASQLSSGSDQVWAEQRDDLDALPGRESHGHKLDTHMSYDANVQEDKRSQRHSFQLRRQPELAAVAGDNRSPSHSRDRSKPSQMNVRSSVDGSRKRNLNTRAPIDGNSIGPIIEQTEAASGEPGKTGPNTPTEDGTPKPLEDDPVAKLPFAHQAKAAGTQDVRTKRERRMQYETSNRKYLSSLATHSTNLSEGLDDTYYSLLEKTATIRSTLRSLRDLPNLTSDLVLDINNEAAGIEQDNRKLITSFDDFKHQIHRIDEFQERLDTGKEKLANLQERIGSVRKEINAWDQKEGEWQARISRRLRLLWAAIGILLFAVLLGVAIDHFRPTSLSNVSEAENTVRVSDSVNSSISEDSLGQGVSPMSPCDGHEDGACCNTNAHTEIKAGITSPSLNTSIRNRLNEEGLQRVIDEL